MSSVRIVRTLCRIVVNLNILSRHLWDPSHRETYESAHSVMLAIFASHAQKASKRSASPEPGAAFAEKAVPMYAQCLVEVRSTARSASSPCHPV